jgi:hypothetical protein
MTAAYASIVTAASTPLPAPPERHPNAQGTVSRL